MRDFTLAPPVSTHCIGTPPVPPRSVRPLATTLVLLGVLLVGCTAVSAESGARERVAPCRWRPVGYRMGMDSVLVPTDSIHVCGRTRTHTSAPTRGLVPESN